MRVLVFATTWIPDAGRARLLDHWLKLARHIHDDCEWLFVDSASPHRLFIEPVPSKENEKRGQAIRWPHVFRFPDNIGHLSEFKPENRDGWGRAFCYGLQMAIDGDEDGPYDYVAHIEGDSLFRLPAMPIALQMRAEGVDAASILSRPGWPGVREIETGLMFFRVGYLRESGFIARYDWPNRKRFPSPEVVVGDILGEHLHIMPWQGRRGFRPVYRPEEMDTLDWVSHAHVPALYDCFVASVMRADVAATAIA